MKFTFIESDEKKEIIAYSKTKNVLIKTIENLCLQDEKTLIGYLGNRIKEIDYLTVECFITMNDKVYALVNNNKFLIKKRLYELYEDFNEVFIYINQGCLANINMIDYFDSSIGGALQIVFKSGYKDYVSRRMLKVVKERMGLRK